MKLVVLAGARVAQMPEGKHGGLTAMVQIGGEPVLWHILSRFAVHGIQEAIVCVDEGSEAIQEFLHDRCMPRSPINLGADNQLEGIEGSGRAPLTVRVVEIAQQMPIGSSIYRLRRMVGDDRFYLAYGDRLSDVDIALLTRVHEQEGALVTLTAVVPQVRYGSVTVVEGSNRVQAFGAQSEHRRGWINAGVYVAESLVLDCIKDDAGTWNAIVAQLARLGKVAAYRHAGFWRAVHTLHDEKCLEALWVRGNAPWKNW